MTFPQPCRPRQQRRLLIAAVAALVALVSDFSHIRAQVAAPVQPKRATNAYLHFAAEKRAEYKKPEMTAPQVAKALGDVWRDLSDAEKEPYMTRAANDKKRYEEELAAFKEAGGIVQTRAKKAHAKVKKPMALKAKAKVNQPKAPRAPSAYNLFMKERMTELKKSSDKKAPELMKDIGKEWSELPDAQKKSFMDQAAAAKAALEGSDAP